MPVPAASRPALRKTAAVVLSCAGAVLALQGPAGAAEPGLAWTPAGGSDSTPLEVVTTGPCPRDAPNVVGVLFGSGFPAAGQVVIGNTDAGVSATGPFALVLGDTLRGFAALQPAPVSLVGEYRLVVTCREPLDPSSRRDYVGSIVFDAAGAFTARQPAVLPRAAGPGPGLPASVAAAPDTTAPDTTAPDVPAPDVTAPDAAAPDPARDPAAGPTIPGASTGGGAGAGQQGPLAEAGARSGDSDPRRTAPLLLLLGGLLLTGAGLLAAVVSHRRGRPVRLAPDPHDRPSPTDHPAGATARTPSRSTSP